MGVCLTVFWAMRTPLRIGPNRSRCCNFIPSAAKLAQAVNWLVGFVVDSFMMMVLLSQVFFPLIGKIHHRSFRKSLCFDSSLSLFWTKFRYVVPRFLAFAAKLVNVPVLGKVIDKINATAVGVWCYHFHSIRVAYLHELAVLLSPTVTKQPVNLGGNNRFDRAFSDVSQHLHKGGAVFHAELSGQP